jgi:hypothetical protein
MKTFIAALAISVLSACGAQPADKKDYLGTFTASGNLELYCNSVAGGPMDVSGQVTISQDASGQLHMQPFADESCTVAMNLNGYYASLAGDNESCTETHSPYGPDVHYSLSYRYQQADISVEVDEVHNTTFLTMVATIEMESSSTPGACIATGTIDLKR